MNDKYRKIGIIILVSLCGTVLLYLGGLFGQMITNYNRWMDSGGALGQTLIQWPSMNPFTCVAHAFSLNGFKAILIILVAIAALILYLKLHDKFSGTEYDPRGFTKNKTGIYGTADWMTDKELKSVLELSTPEKATGMILGAKHMFIVYEYLSTSIYEGQARSDGAKPWKM